MLDYTDYDTRLAGYALVRDQAGRILLSRWVGPEGPLWTVPGGGIEYGESIEDGTVREVLEESGYRVELVGLLAVRTIDIPASERLHPSQRPMRAVQVFHEARLLGGELRFEVDGSSDMAAWFDLAEVAGLERVPGVDWMLHTAGLLDAPQIDPPVVDAPQAGL
ncbi:NUDIX hydrolase [Luteococcus peritonei]|uniref:NUDIX hydrolase n=1 Tax=Luteococcus peritonei TaxID=88874 RepID=A0ABW4RS97_9ACTN